MEIKPLIRDADGMLALRQILDSELTAVSYRYLPSAEGAEYHGGSDRVDADLTAVILELGGRGRRTITWAMEGELEGIAVLGGDAGYAGLADKTIEAHSRDGWRRHVGATITTVGVAWHVSCEDCSESLWALRLGFTSGSAVVALGALQQDLEYMPDEIVVVFDPEVARAYRPRHVSESAWGEAIVVE